MSAALRPPRRRGRWAVLRQVLAWGALILFETLAQVALKVAGERLATLRFGGAWVLAALHEPSAYAAACGYVGAFLAWMTILDRMPPVARLSHELAGDARHHRRLGARLRRDAGRLAPRRHRIDPRGLALMGNEEA